MNHRTNVVSLVAIDRFRRGRLYSWANSHSNADREYHKSLRAIQYLQARKSASHLMALEQLASLAIGRTSNSTIASIETSRVWHPSTIQAASITVMSDNIGEFRALLNLSTEKLLLTARYAHEMRRASILTNRMWQWIDVLNDPSLSINFNLGFFDGTLLGKIAFHEFVQDSDLDTFLVVLIRRVVETLDLV